MGSPWKSWAWSTTNWHPEDMPARPVAIPHVAVQRIATASQLHAIIRPQLKQTGADPSDVHNYRPVSNLALMAKIVEKQVCQQLVASLSIWSC